MSTIETSVVLVHYRTPDLLQRAIGPLTENLRDLRGGWEILVVDNGLDLETSGWRGDPDVRVLTPETNLGYAGGAHFAIRQTSAARLVLMNCDILLQPGCLMSLFAELESGAAVAGPSLYWDERLTFHLPPAEPRTRRQELARAAANWHPALARRFRTQRRRHSHRHWLAEETLDSVHLSGCLLAFTRDVWQTSGGMDVGYPLYFEETDWLLRLQRRGHRSAYVPRARAVHLFDRSAAAEARAEAWFQESAARFRRRHYGVLFERLLRSLPTTSLHAPADLPPTPTPQLDLPRAAQGGWIELGAGRLGAPAVAVRIGETTRPWSLPEELWKTLRPGDYTIVVTDASGRELDLRPVLHAVRAADLAPPR